MKWENLRKHFLPLSACESQFYDTKTSRKWVSRKLGGVGPEVGDWQVAELDGRTRAMWVCHARSDESAAVEPQRHTDAAYDSLDLSWKTQRIANDKNAHRDTDTSSLRFAEPQKWDICQHFPSVVVQASLLKYNSVKTQSSHHSSAIGKNLEPQNRDVTMTGSFSKQLRAEFLVIN